MRSVAGTLGCLAAASSLLAPAWAQRGGGDETAIRVTPHDAAGSQLCAVDLVRWPAAGAFVLRFPETIQSNIGLLFIDHRRPDMQPIEKPAPWPAFGRPDDDGRLTYVCQLGNGVSFAGVVRPVPDGAELEFSLTNGTKDTLTGLSTQFCLMQNEVRGFDDRLLERTYVYDGDSWAALKTTNDAAVDEGTNWAICNVVGARPLTRTANTIPWWVSDVVTPYGLIATVSTDGERVCAIAWERPYKVMSNGSIACLHADPTLPDCPAGETVRVRGRVYLLEAGLDELLRLYRRDF